MKQEKKKIMTWIKEHKKDLIIAGLSISTILLTIAAIKHPKVLEETWMSLKKMTEKTVNNGIEMMSNSMPEGSLYQEAVLEEVMPVITIQRSVDKHLRNLPEGFHASAEKLATAAENGFELLPGQTWVNGYQTGSFAA